MRLRRTSRPDGQRLLVLGWHNVDGTYCFPSVKGRGRRGLRQQLLFLRSVANVVALEPALRTLSSGGSLPPRAVALSFDDGYADNLSVVAPILRSLGLPATFYLVPGLLKGEIRAWWEVVAWAILTGRATELEWSGIRHDLSSVRHRRKAINVVSAALKSVNHNARAAAVEEVVGRMAPTGSAPGEELFLDLRAAQALAKQKFYIGSHTCRHDILSQETAQAQEKDLLRSRQELECELSVPVRGLAYPNGTSADYNCDSVRAAERADYTHALTTTNGFVTANSGPFELPRSVVYPERGVLDLALCVRDAFRAQPSDVSRI